MADPKKVGHMLTDLKKIKHTLVPDADDDALSGEEMKNMDKFQKKKREVNVLLKKIREDTSKLTELRRRLGPDTRDVNCMRLLNDNNKALKTASVMWKDLKAICSEDQRKRAKKLGEKELSDRNKQIQLLGQELCDLTQQNSRVKASAPQNPDQLDEATSGRSRTQKQRQERTERLNKRKQRRAGRTKNGAIELDDDAFEGAAPMSQQEQQFMDQVQANVADQNEMLDEISKGLEELKELSLDMNKTLTVQNEKIKEVGDEMEKTIDAFKSANSKLKDMLDENGGMTRWCPTLVCGCLLLALIGYMFNLFGGS